MTPYTGDPTGLADTTAPAISVPQDTDPRNVASVNTGLSKIADWLAYLNINKVVRAPLRNVVGVWFSLINQVSARNVLMPNLGMVGADQDRFPIDTLQSLGATVYLTSSNDYEIAVNCFWYTPTRKWKRTNAGLASVTRHSPSGVVIQQKLVGGANDTWDDTIVAGGFDRRLLFDATVANQGDVVGMVDAITAKLGRAREAAVQPVATGAWDTTNLKSVRDGSGVTHVYGSLSHAGFTPTNWLTTFDYFTLFTLVAGHRPLVNLKVPVVVEIGGVNDPAALNPVELPFLLKLTTGGACQAAESVLIPMLSAGSYNIFATVGAPPWSMGITINTSFPS